MNIGYCMRRRVGSGSGRLTRLLPSRSSKSCHKDGLPGNLLTQNEATELEHHGWAWDFLCCISVGVYFV